MDCSLCNQYKAIARGRYGFIIDVVLFVIITILFHYLWWHVLGFFRATDFYNAVASWLAQDVYRISLWLNVNLFGFVIEADDLTNTMIFTKNNGYITVNESCSGFKQFYQIFFLFLLFPGPWSHKLWFIPASMILMFFVNIFRIVALSFVLIYWPTQWDFIHLWIMRPFYYVVIFFEWVVWVEYFKNKLARKRII